MVEALLMAGRIQRLRSSILFGAVILGVVSLCGAATRDGASKDDRAPDNPKSADVAKAPDGSDVPDDAKSPATPTPKPDKPAEAEKPITKADAEALLAKLKTRINTKSTSKFAFTSVQFEKLEALIPYLDRAVQSEEDLIVNSTLFAEGKLPENAYTLYLKEALKGYSAHLPRAAKAGNISAMLQMSLKLERGDGVKRDVQAAAAMLQKAADKGSVPAMLRIANGYRSGMSGFPRDYGKSAAWYEKAAEKNSPFALLRLAEYHHHGRHFKKDPNRASELLEHAKSLALKGEKKNNIESIYVLGYLAIDDGDMGLEKQPTAAWEYFRRTVAMGHVRSMNSLAYLYSQGIGLEQPDPEKAVEWWAKASERGSIEATLWLANVYRHGRGVGKDYVKMRAFYRDAALRGNSFAMNEYGYCFDEPLGGDQDLAEALKWYKAGAALNHPKANCNVGTIYYFKKGVELDYDEALKWWRRSAELGDNDAMYKIGIAHRNGNGVEKSDEQAVTWYIRAARAGHEDAQRFLDGQTIQWREGNNSEGPDPPPDEVPDEAPATEPDEKPAEEPVPNVPEIKPE